MVAVQQGSCCEGTIYVLRPDFGGHWRQTVRLYLSLVVMSLSLAMVFTAMGYWPVLPFAGLELTALGAGLYISARRGAVREVVRVLPERIVVERGADRPEMIQTFDRYWSVVELSRPQSQWYPIRLVIRSGGRTFEVGEFLQEEERRALARALGEYIGPMASAGGGAPARIEPVARV